jgi:TRAP-type uncharacterized transport system substrate-binding protein
VEGFRFDLCILRFVHPGAAPTLFRWLLPENDTAHWPPEGGALRQRLDGDVVRTEVEQDACLPPTEGEISCHTFYWNYLQICNTPLLLHNSRGINKFIYAAGGSSMTRIPDFKLVLACVCLCMLPDYAASQTGPLMPAPRRPALANTAVDLSNETWSIPDKNRINDGTVTVITAPVGGATAIFGSDMARVLDDDATIRVLPVIGKGPVRNVVDILYLKSIDMGAVAADVPEFYRLQYKIPDITSRLRYITKLYHNELHIIAPTSIKSIYDLEGKRIVAQTDVGLYSARVIFARLNIKATFDYKVDDARALQKIVDGEADAYITSTGKIFGLARNLKNENRMLHLVSVPYDARLEDMYLPTTLSSEEYPNLLSPGETIETIATSVLLVSFNWPENSERYNRVARFVDVFFSKIEEFLKPPRHPKWREASIQAAIPGWQRFKAADDWLHQHNISPLPQTAEVEKLLFQRFIAEKQVTGGNDRPAQDALFHQFMEWKKLRTH